MSNRATKACNECGSQFFPESSCMDALCPECAHILYGYPACAHTFADGRCSKCHWDRSPMAISGRLFQGDAFEVNHLRHRVVERFLGVISGKDEGAPCLLGLKVAGIPWQQFFLDAGIGFWEQWQSLDLYEVLDDAEDKVIDYAQNFSLAGEHILRVQCLRTSDACSEIKICLSSGTIRLFYSDPSDFESDTLIAFVGRSASP